MRPPDRYSVSPLPSWATVTTQRTPLFSEIVSGLCRHLRGVRPTQRERQLEEAVVRRLASEMEEEGETEISSHGRDEPHGESHDGRTG
jgi:hypothetical protein